jgi:hypothetical protein
MSMINLTIDEKKRLRRIIFLRPRPAKIHRKAVILFYLSQGDSVEKIARCSRLKPEAIARVLDEFQSQGLEAMIGVGDVAAEHRKHLKEVEERAPSREKFRAMLERFPAPDRWLDDDDDWHL